MKKKSPPQSLLSYDKSTTVAVKNVMKKELNILRNAHSKIIDPVQPSSSSSSSIARTEISTSGVPFTAYNTVAAHLRRVLQFPNVAHAVNLISRTQKLQRLELGFRRLKANNKTLLKREIIRSRRGEKAMYEYEMSLKRNEETRKKAAEEAERKLRDEQELKRLKEEEDRRRQEEELLIKKQQDERIRELKHQREEPSALLIQRNIRGYFGRGLIKDIYRKRLMLLLKLWAHGKTSTLFDRPFIKTAMIDGKDCTIWVDLAVHVSRIPSRPFKDLYSPKDVKDIIKKIEKIQREEKVQADVMRREYKQRMIDRENMSKADKESSFIQAWENMLLREKGESLAKVKEKERLELLEQKRRKRAAKLGTMKSQIELEQNLERVEREDMWREDRRSMKVEVIGREKIWKERNRELEIMRVEDYISRNYHDELIKLKEKEEMKVKLDVALQRMKEKEEIEKLRLKKLNTKRGTSVKRVDGMIMNDVDAGNGNLVEREVVKEDDNDTKLLYHDIDVLKEGTIYHRLNSEKTHAKITTDKLFEGFLSKGCSQFLPAYDFKSSEEYSMLKSLILSTLSPISSSHHVYVAHESVESTASLSSFQRKEYTIDTSFDINVKTLTSFLQVNQLRKLRYDRQMQYVLLETALGKFKVKHRELHQLRTTLKKRKAYTRKERLKALEEIALAESGLVYIREALISSTLLFYCMAVEEIEQFAKVFSHQPGSHNHHKKKNSENFQDTLKSTSSTTVHNKTIKTPNNKSEEYTYNTFDHTHGVDDDNVSVGSIKSRNSQSSLKKSVNGGGGREGGKIIDKRTVVGNPVSSDGAENIISPMLLRVNTGVDDDLTDDGSLDDNTSVGGVESLGSHVSLNDDGEHSIGSVNSTSSKTGKKGTLSIIAGDTDTPLPTPALKQDQQPRSSKVAERLQAKAEKRRQMEEILMSNDKERQRKEKISKRRHKYHFKYQKSSSYLPPLPSLKNDFDKVDDTLPTAKHPQEGWIRFVQGNPEDYNCVQAAIDALVWYQKKFRVWLQQEEAEWKALHSAECVSYLQRMDYLCGGFLTEGEGVSTDGNINDQNTWYTRFIAAATILDLKEILLSKFDVHFSVKKGTSTDKRQTSYDLILSGDDLEKSAGRHPASVAPRFLMLLGAFKSQDTVDAYIQFTEYIQNVDCLRSIAPLQDIFRGLGEEVETAKEKMDDTDKNLNQKVDMQRLVDANRKHCEQALLHENLSPFYRKRYEKGFMELKTYMICERDNCISNIQSNPHVSMFSSVPFVTNLLFTFDVIDMASKREMKELSDLTYNFVDQPVFGNIPMMYLLAPAKNIEKKTPSKEWNALKSRMRTVGVFAGGQRGGGFIEANEKPKSKLQLTRDAEIERLKEEKEWKLMFHGFVSPWTQELSAKRWIKVIFTLEEISIECPSWMKPIYRFGDAPPPYSFDELILLETKQPQRLGHSDNDGVSLVDPGLETPQTMVAKKPKSKYMRMKQREFSVHECAKHLTGTLKTRFYITKRKGELAVAEEANLSATICRLREKLSHLEEKIENASMFASTKSLKQERDEVQITLHKLDFKRKNLKPKLSAKETDEIKERVQKEISAYSVNDLVHGWTTDVKAHDGDEKSKNYDNTEKESTLVNELLNNHEMWICGGIHFPIIVVRRITRDDMTALSSRRGSLYVVDGLTSHSSDYFTEKLAHVRSAFPHRIVCSQNRSSFATLMVGNRSISASGLRSLYCSSKKKGSKVKLVEEMISSNDQLPPFSIESQQKTLWETIDTFMKEETRRDHIVESGELVSTVSSTVTGASGRHSYGEMVVDEHPLSSNSTFKGFRGGKKKLKGAQSVQTPVKYVQLCSTSPITHRL